MKFRIRQKNDGRYYVEAKKWWWLNWQSALYYDRYSNSSKTILGHWLNSSTLMYFHSKESAAQGIVEWLDAIEARQTSNRIIKVDIRYE